MEVVQVQEMEVEMQEVMEVASELSHYKHESAMEITDSTNTIVGICFGHLYDQMWDDSRRNELIEKIDEFTKQVSKNPSRKFEMVGMVPIPSFSDI